MRNEKEKSETAEICIVHQTRFGLSLSEEVEGSSHAGLSVPRGAGDPIGL